MTVSLDLALAPQTSLLDLRALPPVICPGLYVHVPFCFHKCHYCDFYSITRQTPERMAKFVDLLLREAGLWMEAGSAGPSVIPRTIFFGGGTPSLLPLAEMSRLLRGLRERFDFSRLDEWTVECNPATVDGEYLAMLREHGVDRLSFGAQSFDRAELKTLERHHEPDDVDRSIELARAAGFARLNLDLIYAIPGQSLQSWSRSLERAIAIGLSHLSCYGLTYEPNTPIAVRRRLGQLVPAAEPLELEMFHHTRDHLAQAGLPAYEISNFAAAGEECRHNLMYWRGGSYAGLGPSAASHVEGNRFRNSPHLGEWERAIEKGDLPAIDRETLTARQRIGERVMLGLRLAGGVDAAELSDESGVDPRITFADELQRLSKLGLLEIDDVVGRFRLTRKGLDVADAVAAEFL